MKLVLLYGGGVKLELLYGGGGVDSDAGVAVWGGGLIVKLVLLYGGV